MYIFILIIHIIVSLILVAMILLQAGKGGGLADTFGGGGSQVTIFGQKASAFLTKATTVSAVLFLCTSLSLAFLSSKKQRSIMEGVKITPAKEQTQAQPSQVAEAPKAMPTVTVKEVKIDPTTGKEVIVKEETRPATEEDIKKFSNTDKNAQSTQRP
jgi:preprotein translocase subunit SecG